MEPTTTQKQPPAKRYNTGKPQLSYIGTMPAALAEFSRVCEFGAEKYERHNYLRGANFSQYMDSHDRHRLAWQMGEDIDPETGCHHLAHAAWNAQMLLEMALCRPDLDDRPPKRPQEDIDLVLRREPKLQPGAVVEVRVGDSRLPPEGAQPWLKRKFPR